MSNNQNKNLNIIDIVENTIEKYNLIDKNDKIVIGVSGGPDSIALLDILMKFKNKYNIDIIVAHINHMIRKESEEEAVYVENMCKKYGVDFEYRKVEVEKIARETKKSSETVGREARYSFFNEVLEKYNADKIAVAHNLDDSVETTFMNLMRGSGINGLIGIKYRNNNIIRPILDVSKKQVLEYCEKENLNPRFDKTNFEKIYTRNKIRLDLLPKIREEYNPNINDTIFRLKEILIEEQNCINEIVDENLNKVINYEDSNSISINRREFKKINLAISKKMIIVILEKIKGSNQHIEKVHINTILDLINNKPTGKKFILGKEYSVENTSKEESIFYKI